MEKQEGLVLELAKEVEEQQALRCGLTASDCQEMSYDNCGTRYPCQTCPADGLDIAACGTLRLHRDERAARRVPSDRRRQQPARRRGEGDRSATRVTSTIGSLAKMPTTRQPKCTMDRLPQMYFGATTAPFASFPPVTASVWQLRHARAALVRRCLVGPEGRRPCSGHERQHGPGGRIDLAKTAANASSTP